MPTKRKKKKSKSTVQFTRGKTIFMIKIEKVGLPII